MIRENNSETPEAIQLRFDFRITAFTWYLSSQEKFLNMSRDPRY
jgi:hypothetical protein